MIPDRGISRLENYTSVFEATKAISHLLCLKFLASVAGNRSICIFQVLNRLFSLLVTLESSGFILFFKRLKLEDLLKGH